jgi:hypothetical protein
MMAEKLNQKEVVSFEEVQVSNVFTQEALINLLGAKGIIKKSELLDEIRRLRKERKRQQLKPPSVFRSLKSPHSC